MENDLMQYLESRCGSRAEAALKEAAIMKLAESVSSEIVHFSYRKMDGSVRRAYGTRDSSLISHNGTGSGERRKSGTSGTFAYYDLEKKDWRCFRYENIIGIDEDYAI